MLNSVLSLLYIFLQHNQAIVPFSASNILSVAFAYKSWSYHTGQLHL